MSNLLPHCDGLPILDVTAGEVLLAEGRAAPAMYVLLSGGFDVTTQGTSVATITEPGAVIGEVSVLTDSTPGATVTATVPSRVHVVDNPSTFMAGDPAALLAIARTLAARLDRLITYLADVKVQYGSAGGHMELLDSILAELAFGEQSAVESGSERDPDPRY